MKKSWVMKLKKSEQKSHCKVEGANHIEIKVKKKDLRL